ncbi:MAG: MFS transporter [Acidimicrobiales bacterium]|nr:MFS transporter [Acidimicrobiales bacterium]HJL99271.1 MFS transporter [Acidimicrobiales bacterium]
MTHLEITHQLDDDGLRRVRRPRTDLVQEKDLGSNRFSLIDGPFKAYKRTLTVTSEPNKHVVIERFDYELSIPWFGFLFHWPVRHALRNRRDDGSAPFWAPPDHLGQRATTIFSTLCAIALLSGFLSNAPAETHTYAADEFRVNQLSQGLLGALIRVGTLLAIGFAVLADRHGRRRILAWAMAFGIAFSCAAALAPSIEIFAVCLVVVRTSNATLGAIIVVFALEELPAGSRAWGLSVLGLSAALGAGFVVWAQPVADVAEWSWRLIFLIPVLMIPLIVGTVRRLPESRRFINHVTGLKLSNYWRPLALLGGTYFLLGLFLSPIDWFRNEYLRDEHGFSALDVSLFVVTTATPGGIGLYIAGRVADLRGRRIVVGVATVLGLGFTTIFFNSSGVLLWPLALAAITLASGLLPAIGVYRAEMFPTAVRARAATIVGAIGVVGGSIGIVAAGWMRLRWGSFGPAMTVLWVGPLIAAVIVWKRFYEGTRQELETLNPEDIEPLGC